MTHQELVEKVAELERRAQEQQVRYDALAESSRDIILFVRLDDGRILAANAAAVAAYGYSRDDLLGLTIRDLRDPESLGLVANQLAEAAAHGTLFETMHRRRDGTLFPVEVSAGGATLDGERVVLSVIRDTTERKRAEDARRQSEARYRAIVEQVPVAIGISHGSVTVEVNERYRQLFRLGPDEEVSGHPLLEQIAPECRAEIAARAERRARGDSVPVEFETVGLRADGTKFPMHVGVVLVDLSNGPATLAMLTDISEQRQAQREREETQAQLRAVVDSTSDLIWSVDPVSFGLLAFNRGLGDYFRRERGIELKLGDRPSDLFDADHQVELWQRLYERALREGSFTTDYGDDGGSLVLQLSLNVVRRNDSVFGISVFGKDVTKQRLAEQALQESNELLHAAFVESPVPASVSRLEDGVLVEVNEATMEASGLPREAIIGRSATELGIWVDDQDRTSVVQSLRRGETVRNREIRLRWADGRVVPTLTSARVLSLRGIEHVMFVSQDISERKRLEAQLLQAQKLESIGRLAGGVAHDFNNLLGVILGYASFALRELRPGDPLRAEILEIEGAAEMAAALTRQLLAFSRSTVMRPTVIDLNAVVTGVERMLRRLIGEDVNLKLDLEPDLGRTVADATQIEQVLMNLAVNARDAMPEGGRLTIATANVTFDETHVSRTAWMEPGSFVALSVADSGSGMDENVKIHLFEPFFTTREKGRGTGLGLSTVYGIVKQAGGDIHVASEPGQGSTFTVYLPRVTSADAAATKQAPAVIPAIGGETLLLVEDDVAVRSLVGRMLRGAGYSVLPAASAVEALMISQHHRGDIHLVLTDVVMPGMSGVILAEQLAKLHPRMKILFMSGYTGDVMERAGLPERGAPVIDKPFTQADLTRRIREVLAAPN